MKIKKNMLVCYWHKHILYDVWLKENMILQTFLAFKENLYLFLQMPANLCISKLTFLLFFSFLNSLVS